MLLQGMYTSYHVFVGKVAAQDIGLSERRILTGLLLLKSSRSYSSTRVITRG